MNPAAINRGWLRIWLAGAIVAFGDAVYLTYHHHLVNILNPKTSSFCSLNDIVDCDSVAASNFSTLFGIPVSTYGVFAYGFLLLFVASLFRRSDAGRPRRTGFAFAHCIVQVLAVFSLYEMGASFLVLQKICIMCTLLYVCVFLMVFAGGRACGASYRAIFVEATEHVFDPDGKDGSLRKLNHRRIGRLAGTALLAALFAYTVDAGFRAYFMKALQSAPVETESRKDLWNRFQALPATTLNTGDAPCIGDSQAPVSIVQFSDFECPACSMISIYLKQIATDPRVRVCYKYLPLDQKCNDQVPRPFHIHACDAARYAYCAYRQDRFWQFHDALYASRDRAGFSPEVLEQLANSRGLDREALAACLRNEAGAAVARDVEEANAMNLNYTPTIFLNGRKVSDVIESLSDLQKIIQQAVEHTP